MHYDENLAAGHPIASGVIEGACRQVVKGCLERTGIPWTVDGAKTLLDLCRIHVSRAADALPTFCADRDIQRLYPDSSLLSQFGWLLAPETCATPVASHHRKHDD